MKVVRWIQGRTNDEFHNVPTNEYFSEESDTETHHQDDVHEEESENEESEKESDEEDSDLFLSNENKFCALVPDD